MAEEAAMVLVMPFHVDFLCFQSKSETCVCACACLQLDLPIDIAVSDAVEVDRKGTKGKKEKALTKRAQRFAGKKGETKTKKTVHVLTLAAFAAL